MFVVASRLVHRVARSVGARRPRGRVASLVCAAVALLAVSCGGGSGVGPTPSAQPPIVSSITPNAGSTGGGTRIRISGANFAAGATISVGGVPATDVTVVDGSTLTAVTGSRAAGTVDVAVSVKGQTGTLVGGFTYAVPGPANNPAPVITSLTPRGSRPNEPKRFADVDEPITVTAVVTDSETPPDQLVYEWSADSGQFSGKGASVTWRAPQLTSTPATSTLSLAVVERYVTTDGVVRENRTNRSVTVAVHDSIREVGDMAVLFLTDFSVSSTPPETVIRNFSTKCRGRADELDDVRDNRKYYLIDRYSVGDPSVSIGFDGVCGFRSRPADACVAVPVRWDVTKRSTGEKEVAQGIDHVTAIYDADRWYLCDSDFESGASTTTTLRFKK